MQKHIRLMSLMLAFAGMLSFSSSSMANIPEYAAWERISQTFEGGHWVVDELCTGIGEVCLKDDFHTIIIVPV